MITLTIPLWVGILLGLAVVASTAHSILAVYVHLVHLQQVKQMEEIGQKLVAIRTQQQQCPGHEPVKH